MNPKIALIGLPFDADSSFMRGPAEAPPLIRKAFYSDSSNLWTEDETDLGSKSLIFDAGDLDVSVTIIRDQITAATADLLSRGLAPIALGGDHAITYPVVKAFSAKYESLSLLLFDAHPDIYDEFQGNRYSHACPFARIMEENLIDRLVAVGIRTMNGLQRQQIEKYGVEVIEMKDLRYDLEPEFGSPLYISIDLDVLDPAFAPGVSHHEPGGLATRELIRLIQSIKAKVVGADIVELNPRRDPLGITAMAGAKILKEVAAKMLAT